MITVNLPDPPSSNNLFLNVRGRGRILTEKYRQWRDDAGWMLRSQKWFSIAGQVHFAMLVPDRGNRDLDNTVKAVLDLLKTHEAIQGDGRKFVRKITLEWADISDARVTVTAA